MQRMEKNVRAVSLIIQLKELYVVLSFTTPPDNTAVEPTHTSLKLKSAVTDTGTFKVCWCFGAWCFFFFCCLRLSYSQNLECSNVWYVNEVLTRLDICGGGITHVILKHLTCLVLRLFVISGT